MLVCRAGGQAGMNDGDDGIRIRNQSSTLFVRGDS